MRRLHRAAATALRGRPGKEGKKARARPVVGRSECGGLAEWYHHNHQPSPEDRTHTHQGTTSASFTNLPACLRQNHDTAKFAHTWRQASLFMPSLMPSRAALSFPHGTPPPRIHPFLLSITCSQACRHALVKSTHTAHTRKSTLPSWLQDKQLPNKKA